MHNSTPALRANHFIHDDFPTGSGTYYIQVTESSVTNDRNMCLQGYGGKVKIGGSGTAPDHTLHVQGTFRATDTATFNNDATFSGGAGAVTIAANSDIRFTSGNWTGESGGKLSLNEKNIIKIPTKDVAIIQQIHILLGHLICSNVEIDYL